MALWREGDPTFPIGGSLCGVREVARQREEQKDSGSPCTLNLFKNKVKIHTPLGVETMNDTLIQAIELLENRDSEPTHEKVFAGVLKILRKYPEAEVEKRGDTTRGIYGRKGDMGLFLRIKIEKLPTYSKVRAGGMTHPLETELRKEVRKYKDGWKKMRLSNETGPRTGRFHIYLVHLSS